MTDDLAFTGIADMQALLVSGALSAVELAAYALERLGRIGPKLNAVANLTPERALAEASAADVRRAAGASGPLLGIPYGAKDLLAARGAPTTFGSPVFEHQVLDHDAGAIERLHRRGAVLTAKLALMEMAAFHALDPAASLQGPGRNPWDLKRWAGGSSSGSGAAVAAGLVPFALGSETGGSIGTPCAYCGITGLRPTYGLVSRHGMMPLSWTLDKIGPMARSAADCALVLDAIAGPDRRDRSSSRRTFRIDSVADALPDRPLRIGYADHDIEEEADEAIRPALRAGLDALRDLASLRQVALPPDLPYMEVISVIASAEGGTILGSIIESDRLDLVIDPDARAGMRSSLAITARSYLNATRFRRHIQAAFAALFEEVDLLVTYTLPWAATPVAERFTPVPVTGGLTGMVAASNLAGLPALFLPVGLTAAGLPVGIQIVAPPFREALLLAVGGAFQAATNWHNLHPPSIAG